MYHGERFNGYSHLLGLLLAALTPAVLSWLIAGGLIYTAGIVFYFYDEKFTHWHGIWHLFVLAGSAAHYTAILRYVAR